MIISERKMSFNKRRSPTMVDVSDFTSLHLREHNANLNTKNYLLSQTSLPPMSYRDLRLVVTNRIPNNLLILPKTSSSPRTSLDTPKLPRPKKDQKKTSKQTGFDVYRSLARSVSHCLANSERDILYDDMTVLANPVTVDRISPLSNTGLFRTHNLPKIRKHHINPYDNQNSNRPIKSNDEYMEYMRSSPPELFHRTTPTTQYYDDENDKMTTATKVLSCMPKNRNRKQLHVYVPSINC
jgi:hypothetical protein